jgi:hypothetical protein
VRTVRGRGHGRLPQDRQADRGDLRGVTRVRYALCLRMILSENRFPLVGITRSSLTPATAGTARSRRRSRRRSAG